MTYFSNLPADPDYAELTGLLGGLADPSLAARAHTLLRRLLFDDKAVPAADAPVGGTEERLPCTVHAPRGGWQLFIDNML